MQQIDQTLAINGGDPVRREPMPSHFLGAALLGDEEAAAAGEVIRSRTLFRHYGLEKPHVADDFETALRKRFKVPYALGVTSGSAALHCAIVALAIGPGDEVILPAFSWHPCYNSIVLAGATPVFCEIDRTLMMDPVEMRKRISPHTKAILVIHYEGACARMDEIMAIAREHGLKVIEDTAQAIGASYKGKLLGTIGDIGTFSMQTNKVLCTGEGGFVLFKDAACFARATRFHDHGLLRDTFGNQIKDGSVVCEQFSGMQFRMSELTAAIALVQLSRLDTLVSGCREKWHKLRCRLAAEAPEIGFRESADVDGDLGIVLFLDLGNSDFARKFATAMTGEGIPVGFGSSMKNLLKLEYVTGRRVPHPSLPPFGKGQPGEHVRYRVDELSQTDKFLESMVPLYIGPLFTDKDMEDIGDAVIKVVRGLFPS